MSTNATLLFFIVIFIIAGNLFSVDKANSKFNNDWNIYRILSVAILTIIPGIQIAKYGTDIYRYQNSIYKNSFISWTDLFEKVRDGFAFYFLGKVFFSIGGRILVFLLFSFILVFAMSLFILDESKDDEISKFVALMVFMTGIYTTGAFNIIRQGIAICIVSYSIKYVLKNDLKKFLFFIIIASLFHSSAIIGLPLYLFWNHNSDKSIGVRKTFFYLLIVMVSVIFYQSVILAITNLLPNVDYYSVYSEVIESKNRDFILDCFELLFFFLIKERLLKENSKTNFALLLLTISVIIGFTGYYNPFFKRIALYYSVPSKIILFGTLPNIFVQKDKKSAEIIVAIVLVGVWWAIFFLAGKPLQFNYDLTNIPYKM